MKILEKIKEITEIITGVDDISLRSRKTHIVKARCIYYKIAKEELDCSLSSMGNKLGLHHATALHSLRKFDTYKSRSKNFTNHYNLVKEAYDQFKKSEHIFHPEVKDLFNRYVILKTNYETVIKKQRKDRRKLMKFLKHDKISSKLIEITKDLNSKQIEQMIDRMEQFAKMCKYHNEKRKIL